MGELPRMQRDVALHFRDELREARAAALRDAEAFAEIVFVLERIGVYLTREIGDLTKYQPDLQAVAAASALAIDIPSVWAQCHAPFVTLYSLVKAARNDALHEGAFARHLTDHAVEVALILEDALMEEASTARDFMVSTPVCASLWQPISSIRRTMLANSFTYLPVLVDHRDRRLWCLVSDFAIASYLRAAASGAERKRRLAVSLKEAFDSGNIDLPEARTCLHDARICEVLKRSSGGPVLVTGEDHAELRGIVTAFDLL